MGCSSSSPDVADMRALARASTEKGVWFEAREGPVHAAEIRVEVAAVAQAEAPMADEASALPANAPTADALADDAPAAEAPEAGATALDILASAAAAMDDAPAAEAPTAAEAPAAEEAVDSWASTSRREERRKLRRLPSANASQSQVGNTGSSGSLVDAVPPPPTFVLPRESASAAVEEAMGREVSEQKPIDRVKEETIETLRGLVAATGGRFTDATIPTRLVGGLSADVKRLRDELENKQVEKYATGSTAGRRLSIQHWYEQQVGNERRR